MRKRFANVLLPAHAGCVKRAANWERLLKSDAAEVALGGESIFPVCIRYVALKSKKQDAWRVGLMGDLLRVRCSETTQKQGFNSSSRLCVSQIRSI